jgi:hypothetical protein
VRRQEEITIDGRGKAGRKRESREAGGRVGPLDGTLASTQGTRERPEGGGKGGEELTPLFQIEPILSFSEAVPPVGEEDQVVGFPCQGQGVDEPRRVPEVHVFVHLGGREGGREGEREGGDDFFRHASEAR